MNRNEGFALVILTAVYAATTLVMARRMRQANDLAREIEAARNRPYVVVDLPSSRKAIFAAARNIGLTPAFDVAVSVDPPLKRFLSGGKEDSVLCTGPISILRPREEIRDWLAAAPEFHQAYPRGIFNVSVHYKDVGKKAYEDKFVLDLNARRAALAVRPPDDPTVRIAEALEDLAARQ